VNDEIQFSGDQPASDELSPALRQAVEAVRAQAIPEDASVRALECTRQLDQSRAAHSQKFRGLFLTTVAAVAAILVITFLSFGFNPFSIAQWGKNPELKDLYASSVTHGDQKLGEGLPSERPPHASQQGGNQPDTGRSRTKEEDILNIIFGNDEKLSKEQPQILERGGEQKNAQGRFQLRKLKPDIHPEIDMAESDQLEEKTATKGADSKGDPNAASKGGRPGNFTGSEAAPRFSGQDAPANAAFSGSRGGCGGMAGFGGFGGGMGGGLGGGQFPKVPPLRGAPIPFKPPDNPVSVPADSKHLPDLNDAIRIPSFGPAIPLSGGYPGEPGRNLNERLTETGKKPDRGKEKEGEHESPTGEGVYSAREYHYCNGKETKKTPLSTSPQVWKRDGSRPTFARVYLGDGNSLELVSLQVTVIIEGPRARTLVDHIFHNPYGRQLEGTFEYPLPSDASPSYFAMFLGQTRDTVPARFSRNGTPQALPPQALASLDPAQAAREVNRQDWGTLREARVVSKQRALETYEDVVRGRIDPALLEYSFGNTFTGRVFPIPAHGYNRVLLAYEELLPVVKDQVLYRFPLPDCPLSEVQLSLQANKADFQAASFLPENAIKEEGGGRVLYRKTWTGKGPGGAAQFAYAPARPEIQAIAGKQGDNGPVYVYARVRPNLKTVESKPFAHNAVFLLDTSQSEHPERFAVSMKLLQKILESDRDIEHFNILTFNVAGAWVEAQDWITNDAAGRALALKRLDGLVLEGATDLASALEQCLNARFLKKEARPLNVFLLSDGQITWGETDVNTIAARFESRCLGPTRVHCYRTGLGADNLELFEALTRKGGGIFACYTEADLPATALAHRRQCWQIERVRFAGGPVVSDVLVAGRQAAVYPGGELIVAGRFQGTGKTQLLVEGRFQGQKFVQEYPVEVSAAGELASRGWAEIAVASLLALNDPHLDSLVTAYCQQFGIGSRVASFLVLENDADYKRFNLDEERGKTISGDLGHYLDTMWQGLARVILPREAFVQFLTQLNTRVPVLSGPDGDHVKKLLALLSDADYETPAKPLQGTLLRRADVPPTYLSARDADRHNVDLYLAEARRRSNQGDADGAIRVLSSIVEEYPARADALRLVGYRLLDFHQAGAAVGLFQRVERSRPFEPHSYRDLACSLQESARYGLAAVQYEILLAGAWSNRFHESLKVVAQEEYAHMMQDAIRQKAISPALANCFGERLERLTTPAPQSDLRVTISWNTDGTDVDLWVIEPDGTKCFYRNPRTPAGGELSQDQTQGYGPERYQIRKAKPGVYTVIVHYYSANPNLLGGETHVNILVARQAGSPEETVERHTVILKKANEQVEVCKVKF
jgi:hypothetical protein